MIDLKRPRQHSQSSRPLDQGQGVVRSDGVEICGDPQRVLGSPPFCFFLPHVMSEKSDSNKPVQSFRLKGVTASVFANQSEDSTFYKVTLQRSYKQGDEWKTTTSFGRDDLPIVSLLTKQAWEYILNTESKNSKEGK